MEPSPPFAVTRIAHIQTPKTCHRWLVENLWADQAVGFIGLLLHYLRQLQRQYTTAVLLVHHIRKSAAAQPGQALRGSGDLHAWSDSNLYLLRKKGCLVLHAEHRTLPSPDPVAVELTAEPHAHLSVIDQVDDDTQQQPDPLGDRILAILSKSAP